jgi:hypothetical protein
MYDCIRHVGLCAAVAVGLAAALQGQVQKKYGNLPTLEEVLHKPAMTIDQISATYTELEKHLQAEQYQMSAEQAEKKSMYAQELQSKLEEQRSILTQNSELETRLTTERDENKKLRSQAAQLVRANEALSVDMQVAQGNMSNAADFVASAIDESRTLLLNSSALAVLAELAEKDASITNQRTQKSRMDEIRGHAAMIQTTAQKESPQNVLAEIMSSMDVVAQAHNESLAKMKSEFDANARFSDERSKNLLEKQSELNASLAEEAIIHKKLLNALTHLRDLNQRLIEQSRSVRMFAQRFSGKVNGTSLKMPGAEPNSVLSKASNVVLGFSQLFHSAVSSETNSETQAVKPAHSVSAATEAYVAKHLDSAVEQESATSSLNRGASEKSVSSEAAQPVTLVAPAPPASTLSGKDIASLKAVPRKKKHDVAKSVAKAKTPPSPSDGGITNWAAAVKEREVTGLVTPAALASRKAEAAAPASHSSDGEMAKKKHVHAKLAAPTHTKSATPTHTKSAAPTSTTSKHVKRKSTRKHKASGAKAEH